MINRFSQSQRKNTGVRGILKVNEIKVPTAIQILKFCKNKKSTNSNLFGFLENLENWFEVWREFFLRNPTNASTFLFTFSSFENFQSSFLVFFDFFFVSKSVICMGAFNSTKSSNKSRNKTLNRIME